MTENKRRDSENVIGTISQGDPPTLESPGRRCSTRLLSQSVHQTLKQLQKEQYEARVAQLVKRNRVFYRRQRICESSTAFVIIVSFSVFSVYMVLSYGFNYFWTASYSLTNVTTVQSKKVGEEVTLICQADDFWEWCRWVHKSQWCEWEWVAGGVKAGGCTMSVRRAGDYSQHQCGLTFTAAAHHSGVWVCELERYHSGFSRRYGELRYGQVTVSVSRDLDSVESTTVRTTNMTTSTSTTSTTSTTPEVDITMATHAGIRMPINRTEEDEEIYQRNFLILKVVVRTTVVITLVSLAAAFAVLFLHNWRLWEQNMPGQAVKGNKMISESEEDTDTEDLYQEIDPMLKRKLVQTRRKSVAFSVCVVDRENMTFDLESKRVMLGLATATRSTDRLPHIMPTWQEEAECETEKMGLSIPLIMSGPDNPNVMRFNSARRMSVPAVTITRTLQTRDPVNIYNSRETVI